MFHVLTPGKTGTVYKSLVEARADGANVLAYGDFIQTIVDFLIIAFFIFLAIQAMARMERKNEIPATEPVPSSTDLLLTDIRDELRKRNSGI
jgi:large conductance mechanosensitive channel